MKYAIFDLDGTLLDSMWVWENMDVDFLAKYNKMPANELREKVRLLSVRQSAELFKTEFKLAASTEEIMREIAQMGEGKYEYEVVLKPYVLEYLQYLKKKRVKMCVATAATRKNAISALTRLEILDFFEFAVTSEDVETGKDSPEIFLLCADRLGAAPQNIVVFEDTLHAIETAKSAGFKVAGVYDKSAERDEYAIKNLCDYYINNFDEPGDIF